MLEPNETSNGPDTRAFLAAIISLIIPGGGQFWLGNRRRGLTLFSLLIVLALLVGWNGSTVLAVPVIVLWLWNVWDAFQLGRGRSERYIVPFLLGAIIIYGVAYSVTEVNPRRLVTGWPAMQPYVRALFQPELFEYPTEDTVGTTPILIPCIDPLPAPSRLGSTDPILTTVEPCAAVGDTITIVGSGYEPNFEGEVFWTNPIGDVQRVIEDGRQATFSADADGNFTLDIKVPQAVPLSQLPAAGETQTHIIRAEQRVPYGSPEPTQTLRLVMEKIGETIALAFLATVLGAIFALPLSFLAARNLMSGNRVTRAVYTVVRGALNLIRSIETLIWAIVFAVWVGLGPFGGMLALMFHTIAALGKLYSEAIEGIDPGPIEAIKASGARWPQIVRYAVMPQILPTFTSYTLYRWDINVRMSTVIGLVSDAGLGFLVIQWIRLNEFRAMATAILAIIVVIMTLDYASSWLRKRIIEGVPQRKEQSTLRKVVVRGGIIFAFVVAFIWSWNIAEIDMTELVKGAPDGLALVQSFAIPDVIDFPTEQLSVTATLPVPCDSAESPSPSLSGPRVVLEPACGEPGEKLVITGYELPPDTTVSVRWVLYDDAFLRVKSNCCDTDADGNLRLETFIHPLLEVNLEEGVSNPGKVAIVWEEVTGGPQVSETVQRVLQLALVTLLMALLATTIGTAIAVPLSFLAARNIMGDTRIGLIAYNVLRTSFNIFRAIEPMILVLICAAWVGAGPFAGMLALALNNIPNLGKLFSEAIEEIDNGPVEAVTSTGATKLQALLFAIVPQIVPQFMAYILYQWDINIRMSTVIGFVGGGGIGQQFRLWVGLNQYAAAGTAIWAIVIMVWSMDYISAKARERLV
ncbi:MAG: phosphonate ABC transporter, permease protein PhnE [Anaerolineae bacterium]|nr:phosphonate ABC transporter, permease protein PhnE [Anaerolineae bacterium]